MKDNRKILILIIGVFLIFVITAIYIVGNRGSTGEVASSGIVTEESSGESSDTEISDTGDIAASEAAPETAISTKEVVTVIPTVRAGLESTDPASVNLTSGDIQLVEIFAFW